MRKEKKKGSKSRDRGKIKPDSVENLIQKANDAISKVQFELAQSFYEKALELEPLNTNLMDALADVQLQLGNSEYAFDLLSKSTELSPEENPFKWLYFGQLQDGLDALTSFERGVSLLVSIFENNPEVFSFAITLSLSNRPSLVW